MKREMVMWLIIAVLVVALLLGTQKAGNMAIDFESSVTNQGIVFGDVDALKNLTIKTMCTWFNAESFSSLNTLQHINRGDETAYGYVTLLAAGKIRFAAAWDGSTNDMAYWDSNAALSIATEYLVCVEYDNSLTTNDPVYYVNGSSVALTEITAPVGTVIDSGGTTKIGGYGVAFGSPFDGIIRQSRVYNRALTPAEHLQLYNARGRDNIKNGLVFCPFLKGAAGLQAFDGATLAAGNTIVDPCSGAVGVPAGNPVGVGETYLR